MILKALGSISVIFDSRREAGERGRVGSGNCPCSEVSGPNRLSTTSSVGGILLGSAVEESVVSSTDAVVIIAFDLDGRRLKKGVERVGRKV